MFERKDTSYEDTTVARSAPLYDDWVGTAMLGVCAGNEDLHSEMDSFA